MSQQSITTLIICHPDGGSAFSAEQLLAVRDSGWVPLGARDRRLVELLVAGKTNKEMATAIGVSRQAIETRLSHLCRRFDVESRVELALRAEREGWLAVPGEPAVAGVSRRLTAYRATHCGEVVDQRGALSTNTIAVTSRITSRDPTSQSRTR